MKEIAGNTVARHAGNDFIPRWRDLYYGGLERAAKAFSLGAEKLEKDFPPGLKNYHLGDVNFALARMDHMLAHAMKYNAYVHDRLRGLTHEEARFSDEDHLGHMIANALMLADFEDRDYFTGEGQQMDLGPAEQQEVVPELPAVVETASEPPEPVAKKSLWDVISGK